MRVMLIVELDKIIKLHNELCNIFDDQSGIQPSIITKPSYYLTGAEIRAITG